MIKLIYLISIFAICLLSCKDKDNKVDITVKGTVVDYYSGIPIPLATVLLRCPKTDPQNPQLRQLADYDSINWIVDRIVTDSEGKFNKTISVENQLYKMIVFGNGMISTSVYQVAIDSIQEYTINVKRLKPLTIKVTNSTLKYLGILINVTVGDMLEKGYNIHSLDTTFIFNAITEEYCHVSYRPYDSHTLLEPETIDKLISISKADSITINY